MTNPIEYIAYHFELWLITRTIALLKKGYGADCETTDLEDFPGTKRDDPGRCASCRAKEVIDWLEDHISLMKEYG